MMIYLSNFLSNKKNDLILYTFSYNKKVFPLEETNFLIKYYNTFKVLSIFKIAYNIRNSDYIIIWNSPMHFVWVISKILFWSKAKLIWWNHHYPWYYSSNANVYIKLKRLLETKCIKKIDLLISNSKYLQQSIKSIYKRDSEILYPVLDDKFLDYNIKDKSIVFTPPTIFIYGRWVKGKNLKLIFQTYEVLKDKIPNLVLKIWWEWDLLTKYKNKSNIEGNIFFLWTLNKEQIIKNLKQSNLFLFSSKVDSFWLVILESMAFWIPVISYNVSWAKEIIKNWINWYLVNSEKEFISRSYEVLSNSSLGAKLWIWAVKTANKFWVHNFEKQLSNLFNSISVK